MEKGMRLCGGTFFTLLIKIKSNRKITNPECLQGLVNIFHADTEHFKDSTYTSETSSYKNCELGHSEWLVFDDRDAVKDFSDKIGDPIQYVQILKEMEDFVGNYLSQKEEKQTWLVHALLELIDSDDLIPSDAVFYINKDGQSVIKKKLVSDTPNIYAPSFLLGIWHYIIANVDDNLVGKNTLEKWNGKRDKHTIGKLSKLNIDGRFSCVSVNGYKQKCSGMEKEECAKPIETNKEKKLTTLEKKLLASGQAMAEVWEQKIKNIENEFEKKILYSSVILSDAEVDKYKKNDAATVDVTSFFDPNNNKLIYRYVGSANFTRKLDEFKKQNVIISANIDNCRIESYTTYDNWKSKSYVNNILSEGDYECKIWFKIIKHKDENTCQVQILLIEEK